MFQSLRIPLTHLLICSFVLAGSLTAFADDTGSNSSNRIPETQEVPAYRMVRGFKPEINAVRVDTPPKIDGHLDEEIWRTAPAGGPLIQNRPQAGQPMLQPSEFRVAYDDNYIYVALWHWDSEPEKIVARYMRRDDSVRPDDYSIVVFDTFNDQRNGYWFRINPNGARQDAIISNNTSWNGQWDGIWEAKTQVTAFGWFAELAFPVTTFSFDPDSSEWGLNVTRSIKLA